jgi:hypothetical protein
VFVRRVFACTNAARAESMQRRYLHVHEYQSQQIMAQHNIRVPRAIAATTPVESF